MIDYKYIIKKLTSELGIKENELAKRLGITQATLTERKKKNAMKFDDVIELCLEEKIDLNELFTPKHKFLDFENISMPHKSEDGCYPLSFAYSAHRIPYDILPLTNSTYSEDARIKYSGHMLQNNTMAPYIRQYDSVIFVEMNSLMQKMHDGSIILFKFKGSKEKHCRKVFILPNDILTLTAINKDIPQYSVKRDEIEIFGVVVTIIKNHIN